MDQRGGRGRSTPLAELATTVTDRLIADIRNPCVVFGGMTVGCSVAVGASTLAGVRAGPSASGNGHGVYGHFSVPAERYFIWFYRTPAAGCSGTTGDSLGRFQEHERGGYGAAYYKRLTSRNGGADLAAQAWSIWEGPACAPCTPIRRGRTLGRPRVAIAWAAYRCHLLYESVVS